MALTWTLELQLQAVLVLSTILELASFLVFKPFFIPLHPFSKDLFPLILFLFIS